MNETFDGATSENWPADAEALERAREFLRAAAAAEQTVLACDHDVDGLCSAVLLRRVLRRIGAAPESVSILPVERGEHVHGPAMQARIAERQPSSLVVLDMGSRSGPILPGVPTLLIDHHQPQGFPDGALVLSAFGHEPVAPTSLLAFELCRPLADSEDLLWLAALGTIGDLGAKAQFDAVQRALPAGKQKNFTESVALLNAARRSAEHDVQLALDALEAAREPADVAQGKVVGVERLRAMREQVKRETTRCSRTAPQFAGDVALLRFSSPAQVHPLVAVRWLNRLPHHVVLAANDGFLPGRVNFSVRTKRALNLIDFLRQFQSPELEGDLAFGHPRATGGSLTSESFQQLLRNMGFAV